MVLRSLLASKSEVIRLRAADRLLSHGLSLPTIEALQRCVEELEIRRAGVDVDQVKERLAMKGIDLDKMFPPIAVPRRDDPPNRLIPNLGWGYSSGLMLHGFRT